MIENEISRFHILVTGRVQGVGFRYFAREQAESLKLSGWVKNLDDGAVEIEAQGNKDLLKTYIIDLKSSHPYASVNKVQFSEMVPKRVESGFLILF